MLKKRTKIVSCCPFVTVTYYVRKTCTYTEDGYCHHYGCWNMIDKNTRHTHLIALPQIRCQTCCETGYVGRIFYGNSYGTITGSNCGNCNGIGYTGGCSKYYSCLYCFTHCTKTQT